VTTHPARPTAHLRTFRRPLVSWLVAVVAVGALGALGGCAFGQPDQGGQQGSPPNLPTPSASPSQDDGGASVQVIAKNLAVPWAIGFLPDGTALVTERDLKQIVKLAPDQSGTLVTTPVQTVDAAVPGGEGGLLGLAVSPNYKTDKTVYLYYSTNTDNRIAKLVLGGQPSPIVTGIPRGAKLDGGALAFGPDGDLYAGTGTAGNDPLAQDAQSLGGKILRMTTDGKPAPGNPTPGSLVYASGLRNVQGLAWDTKKQLYATDMGQDKADEIDAITAGKNYGWPTVEGTGGDPRFVNPVVQLPPSQASCSGLASSGAILVAGCLVGKRVWLAQLDGKGGVLGSPQHTLDNQFGRLRAVVTAPDGTLWVSTSNKDGRGQPTADDDRILRLVISGGNNVDKS
jgi:glucose/arabinose dehydrogenase